MQYVYPAIFQRAIEGGYCIDFPDIPGAFTQGEDIFDAIEMAEDLLSIFLLEWEDYKAGTLDDPIAKEIAAPTPIEEIVAEPDEYSTSAFVTLIKADTDAYRKILAEMREKERAKEVTTAENTTGAA